MRNRQIIQARQMTARRRQPYRLSIWECGRQSVLRVILAAGAVLSDQDYTRIADEWAAAIAAWRKRENLEGEQVEITLDVIKE